jgi:hypothetical protein
MPRRPRCQKLQGPRCREFPGLSAIESARGWVLAASHPRATSRAIPTVPRNPQIPPVSFWYIYQRDQPFPARLLTRRPTRFQPLKLPPSQPCARFCPRYPTPAQIYRS